MKNLMINRVKLVSICVALVFFPGCSSWQSGRTNSKKLQVFVLAGQSNMVGHSYYITIPTLLTAKEPKVRELANLVFKKDAKISKGQINSNPGRPSRGHPVRHFPLGMEVFGSQAAI